MPRSLMRRGAGRDLDLLFGGGALLTLTDGELLDRFVSHRDEAAVAALVARHGGMVLGVCRRVLLDPHDADDAFQATFLVLARRAATVRPADGVARWLHGVALRTARKARALRDRRRGREAAGSSPLAEVAAPPDGADPDLGELLGRLDRAIAALPGRYRAPVVLCLLEGRTHREAADLLGWPVGTVSGRLSRGRSLLIRRVRASAGPARPDSLALPPLVGLPLPGARVAATARAMTLWGLGRSALTTAEMAPILLLSREVMRTMTMSKIKAIAVLALGAGLAVGGGVGLVPTGPTARVAAADPTVDPDLAPLQGLWTGKVEELMRPHLLAAARFPELPVQVLVERDMLSLRGVSFGRFSYFGADNVMVFRATSVRGAIGGPDDRGRTTDRPVVETPDQPRMIDLTVPAEPDDVAPTTYPGVYQVDGDTLRVCLNIPSKRRPRRAATEPGTHQILLTLRRSPDRNWGDLRESEAVATGTPKPAIPAIPVLRDPATGRPIGPKQPSAPVVADQEARPVTPPARSFQFIPQPKPAEPANEPSPRPDPPATRGDDLSKRRESIRRAARAIADAPEVTPDLVEPLRHLLDPQAAGLDPADADRLRAYYALLFQSRGFDTAPALATPPQPVDPKREASPRLDERFKPVEEQPASEAEAASEILKRGVHDAIQGKPNEISFVELGAKTFAYQGKEPPDSTRDGLIGLPAAGLVEFPTSWSAGRGMAQVLARTLSCRVIRAEEVTRDAMILGSLTDWNHGDVDNLGISNEPGGVRTLVDWHPIPPELASDPDRRFFLAFYARATDGGPDDPGAIQAAEILEEWPERISWRTKPETGHDTVANFRFEPGAGWKLLDVTPLVQARARQNRIGRGIALRFVAEHTGGEKIPMSRYQMVSREGQGEWQSKRPQLIVVEPLGQAAKP